jgi:hypothetical protein
MNIKYLQDVRQEYVLRCHGRQRVSLPEASASDVSDLFSDVESLLSAQEFPPFEIISFRFSIVEQLAMIEASIFTSIE